MDISPDSWYLSAIQYLKDQRIIIKDSELAIAMDIDKSTLSNYLSGRKTFSKNFKTKFYDLYSDHLKNIRPGTRPDGSPTYEIIKNNSGVPVYDVEATAGNMELSGTLPEIVKGYINLPNFKDCIAFLYLRGDSMYPKFKAGDLIGVAPVEDMDIIQYGQVYLVITKDNQRMVKYIRKGEDDQHLILRSENDNYDDIRVKKEKLRKLFRVKGPIRDDWQ